MPENSDYRHELGTGGGAPKEQILIKHGCQIYPRPVIFWHAIFDMRECMTAPDLSTSDSFEQALEFARAALQGMTTHSIAPTPENFLVWYNAHIGSSTFDRRRYCLCLPTAKATLSS